MNVQELSLEFDIYYNSIAGASAPGIDEYEKSIYLTKAQLEIIKNYYDPSSNRKQKGFEASEKRRVDLKQLIKDYKSSTSFIDTSVIHSNSKYFNIPEDVFLIVNERVKIISNDCYNNDIIEVKPTTYDEFSIQINNPFKQPNNNIAWRLDISNINNNKVVEIISPYEKLEYRLRYIKYPKPIILEDLSINFPTENLTIDGEFLPSTSELDEEIHREILDRAVELCIRDYKSQDLQSKVQLDIRNE